MNEDIKQMKKRCYVTTEDIADEIGLSRGYVQHLLGKELSQEKRELIINAIYAKIGVKVQNVKKQR